MRTDEGPIIVEQQFNKTADVVWEAITEINQMVQWFFENIPSFLPEVGFETQFNVQSGPRNFLHLWKVTEVNPGKLIKYNWSYKDYEGDSEVVFELFSEGSSTLLRLTHVVKENFSDDIPEFRRESGIQGWTYFINESLLKFLEKK